MAGAGADENVGSGPRVGRWTLGELLNLGIDRLAETGQGARLDAELLLAQFARCARSTVIAFPERSITDEVAAPYLAAIERRAQGVPIAQITGRREFHSLELVVNEHTLVPRPETELLVEQALASLARAGGRSVLDLGTGSGAIAIAIAIAVRHASQAVAVTAVDISAAALEVARDNARRLGVEIRFVESDWFAALPDERFDLIVANPPYVASVDPLLAGPLRHEPRIALAAGPDGLDAIRDILRDAPAHMSAGARLLMEHGSTQRDAVAQLAAEAGFALLAAHRDLAGHDRVVVLAHDGVCQS
jgi:release factor glutamine methyltransferase